MPYTFTVDSTIPLVRVYGAGALSLEDIRRLSDDLAAHGVFALPRLVDMRDATLHISAAQVQEYVHVLATYRKQYGSVRVATVVLDPATYGLLRMYQILSSRDNTGFGVFRTMLEAMDWLQVGPTSSSICAQQRSQMP